MKGGTQVERSVRVSNKMGLHVRPATRMASTAREFRARIRIVKGAQEVDAKSCIELLTLAAVQGTELLIRAEGDDAREAVDALANLIESGFSET